MTLENAKRLYEFYLSKGRAQEAQNLLDKRPELKAPETPKEEKPSRSKK